MHQKELAQTYASVSRERPVDRVGLLRPPTDKKGRHPNETGDRVRVIPGLKVKVRKVIRMVGRRHRCHLRHPEYRERKANEPAKICEHDPQRSRALADLRRDEGTKS